MFKTINLLLTAICFFTIGNAQVKTNFNNSQKVSAQGRFVKEYATKILELAPPDLSLALRRDQAEGSLGSKVFYIAEPISTNINVVKLASWITYENYEYGRFTLTSKGAKTLSVNFSDFYLPKGTEMYIYNKEAEMITGVVTEKENNKDKLWGSSIYKGNEITIEIKIPSGEKEKLNLQITNVAYGYKDIFISKTSGFGQSGACNINVLCPEGNNWVAERNSVVYIAQSNGSALCSGAMLMNTCAVNIPYVLTANHCFQGDGNVAGWRVHFQAWSPTCTPNQNSDGILFNGSTLRANWAPSDFCLIQLNQTPAANSDIHYAGWSRATAAATSGVGIHHPSGDVMKISNYTTPLVREDDPVRCGVNAVGELHWVVLWNQGVTEGGSSGSPLFDQDHRIVGQLSGGPSSCAQPANCRMDMYGRFDNSWTGGGTNATRLSNWLDPNNTNAMTTNTTSILNLTNANLTLSINGDDFICSGNKQYTLTGSPTGATIIWTSSDQNVAQVNGSGSQATVTYINNGVVSITATVIHNCFAQNIVSKQINIGTPTVSFNIVPDNPGQTYCASSDGNFFSISPVNIPNVPFYQWGYITNPNGSANTIIVNNFGSNQQDFTFTQKGDIEIFARPGNNCGLGNIQILPITITTCGGFESFASVSPNPTSGDIKISTKNKANSIKGIRLMDKLGNLRKEFKNPADINSQQINISELPTGIYILQVFDGVNWWSKKIVKN